MIKKHKSIFMVAALVLLLTASFCCGTMYVQYRAESNVQAMKTADAQAAKTPKVSSSDIEVETGEDETSRELAKKILQDIPDAPLLDENATEHYGNNSLELTIDDINATTSEIRAKDVILQVCEEAGIDAQTAKVKDLTEEQIMYIDMTVYKYSDHPKN